MAKKSHTVIDGKAICGAPVKRNPPDGMPPTCAACRNGGKPPQPVRGPQVLEGRHKDMEPDYTHTCEVCGATPVMPATGMCGPCTTGDASTIEGNW